MQKKLIGVFLTDTHLAEDNTETVIRIFRQAVKFALDNKLERIFHLGDIFESRKGQTQELLSVFDDILDEIKQAGLKMILIPGNHDKQDYGSWKSFLKAYQHHPALMLIQMAGGLPLTDDIFLTMIPFFEDDVYLNQLDDVVNHGGRSVKNILGTHIGVQGAVMNSGIAVDSAVTPNHFRDYDLVLIGHYHDPQELAEGKIKYIGSSLQHDFGEGEVKGICCLYDDLSTETVPLQFPKFRSFKIPVVDVTLKDIQDIKTEKATDGDFIRIILTGAAKDLKSFNGKDLKEAGVKVVHEQDAVDKEELESRIEPFDATSLLHEYGIFCEKNKLDAKEGMLYFKPVING